MGKYTDVLLKLPKFTDTENVRFQALVAAFKGTVTDRSAAALARAYHDARVKKDALEDQVSSLNVEIEALVQLLDQAYEEEGVQTIKLENGASVAAEPEPYAAVLDREALRAWTVAQGLERLLSLPWQTTNSMTKEALLAGRPLPDGVEAFSKPKFVLRKKVPL